jgi:small nuclear ribonucleoprotein (snRNP)-like protein
MNLVLEAAEEVDVKNKTRVKIGKKQRMMKRAIDLCIY